MLAGVVQAPSRLAPTNNLALAQARSKLVLKAMADTGAVSRGRANAATAGAARSANRARFRPAPISPIGSRPQARDAFEADFGEVKVRTTLDADLQRLAVRAVSRAAVGNAQAALVAMRPDGRVVAMVGGKSYKDSPFNRATQARRQPGSAFKLFVYLAALRAGWTPDSMIEDRPVTIDGWTPANNDGVYRGEITLREAFARSSNAATVRLSESVGRANVMRAARELGITTPLPNSPSLALGTAGVSLLELTSAYAAVASGRYPIRARGLAGQERDGDGSTACCSTAGDSTRGATGRRCSTCFLRRRTTAPDAARRLPFRRSARPERARTIATPCSSALPAISSSGCGSAATTTSRWARTCPAEPCRRRSGATSWCRRLRWTDASGRRSLRNSTSPNAPSRARERQSPLPDEWSEGAEPLREIIREIEKLFE